VKYLQEQWKLLVLSELIGGGKQLVERPYLSQQHVMQRTV